MARPNDCESSFEFIEDSRLLDELNSACKRGDNQQVRALMCRIPPSSRLLKYSYKPPIFWACKFGQFETVKVLVDEYHCDPHYVSERGHTLVHVACIRGHVEVARYLAKQQSVDPNKANNDGATPLLSACNNGHISTVVLLIDELKCDPHALGENNRSLLHVACRNGRTEIAQLLVGRYGLDPKARDSYGVTPLHIASSKGHLHIAKYLVDELKCPVEVFDRASTTPLHNACRNGQVDIVEHLVDSHKCSLHLFDNSGFMPFHVACRYGRTDVIKLLLDRGFNPNTSTLSNETPIQIVRDKGATTELIRNGAKTDGVNLEILRLYQDQHPLDSLVHLLVIGHEGSGKSTMVKALQTSVSVSDRLFRILGPCLVNGVKKHTAGIIPISFRSPEFGKVMVFDFAGQYDYHPSHAAVLEHSNMSSAPLFLLVVNLLELLDIDKRRINYWVNFVENNPIPGAKHPHAIVIASHRDELRKLYPRDYHSKISALDAFTRKRFSMSKITLDGFFALDCREVSSDKHAQLRKQLQKSCVMLRSNIKIDARCHVLMVMLLKEFEGKLSCTIDDVSRKVKASDYPLPIQGDRLCELAEALSTRTEILFIRHKLCPEKSWILLQMDTFLNKIHGRIFAPKEFPKCLEASQAGVVQWSQLRDCFSDFPDPNLVVAFLGHFEECKVIDDPEVLALIDDDIVRDSARLSDTYTGTYLPVLGAATPRKPFLVSPSTPEDRAEDDPQTDAPGTGDVKSLPSPPRIRSATMPTSSGHPEKYLFIPGLITAEYPASGVWTGREGYTLYSGWCLQCAEKKFFDPRFLQALLLRLTFGYAVSQPTTCVAARPSSIFPSRRECTLWKNGLRWLNLDGIETIVEFVEDRKAILVLMRAKQLSEMKCVRLRSALIQKIIETKNDYCPADLVTSEFLINPSHIEQQNGYPVLSQPLCTLRRYDISSVAEAFVTRSSYVYDTKRDAEGFISIKKLVYFDSYTGVNQSVLCKLYDHQKQTGELRQDLLLDFSLHSSNSSEDLKEALLSDKPAWYHKPIVASDNMLLNVLLSYFETKCRSVGDFRNDLDSHSLFAGRNILEVQHSTSPATELTGRYSLY